jgi:hypothetical protein
LTTMLPWVTVWKPGEPGAHAYVPDEAAKANVPRVSDTASGFRRPPLRAGQRDRGARQDGAGRIQDVAANLRRLVRRQEERSPRAGRRAEDLLRMSDVTAYNLLWWACRAAEAGTRSPDLEDPGAASGASPR